MNVILLLLTNRIRKQSIHWIRLLLSAMSGALIASLSALMSKIPIEISFLLDYGVTSVLMVSIAFGKKKKREFIQTYITFLLCSFLLGGIVQSLSETFQAGNHLKGFFETVLHSRTKLIVLIVLSAILTPFILYLYQIVKENSGVIGNIYDVKICLWNEKQIVCKGFMDSGNSLKDPVKGWPVIVADQSLLQEEVLYVQKENPTAFCVIPYVSVGKESGILYGIRADSVTITNQQDTTCTKNVVVALSEHGFANRKEYRVLLHNDLLRL